MQLQYFSSEGNFEVGKTQWWSEVFATDYALFGIVVQSVY